MTTERIDIVINEDGSRTVRRNLKDMGGAAEDAADSFDVLKSAVLGLFAVFSFNKFAELTGVWTDLNARVNRFSGSVQGTTKVMDRLLSIAQRTYAPLESISNIYLENAFSLEQLGKSTEQTLDYTEALTNALVVSGAKGQRQEAVISAMSKAMLEGKLAGDNWNTVLTQGGRVVEAITAKTGKSLTELKQMAAAGQLSSDTVFSALTEQLDMLREEADAMPATIGDAFTRLENQLIKTVGTWDQKLGLSSSIVKGIDWITQHLDDIIPVLTSVGVAIASVFAVQAIQRFIGAVKVLWVLIAANPLAALATVLVGVITYLYQMRDVIKLGIDDTTTFGDLMRAVWEQVLPVIKAVGDFIAQFFAWLTQTSGSSFNEMLDDLNGYEHANESTWLKILRAVARTMDAILGLLLGLYDAAKRVFSAIADFVTSTFSNAIGQVKAIFAGDFDKALALGAENLKNLKGTGVKLGNALGEGLDTGFGAMMEGGFESRLDKLIGRAQEIGKGRKGDDPFTGFKNQGGPAPPAIVDPKKAEEAAKKLQQLKDALDGVWNRIDPLRAAQQELAKSTKILNDAETAGLLPKGKAAELTAKLTEQMKEQLQPYEYMLDKMKEEAEVSKKFGQEKQIESQLREKVNTLTAAGVKVTDEMTASLRAQLVVQQQLDAISQQKEAMFANSNQAILEQTQLSAEAMRQLLDDTKSGFTKSDALQNVASMLGDIVNQTSIASQLRVANEKLMYDQIEALRQKDIISETQASEIKKAIARQEAQARMQLMSDSLGYIAGLMNSNNKTAFRIGKAAAIAQATMNTYTAAVNAYQSASAIPYVGWILGPLAAAGAVAAGMAQVNAIRSQQMPAYRLGGDMVVGGNGGVDSQTVSLRATPGERISVNTPAQARALEKAGQGAGKQEPPRIRIINVSSEQEARNFANSDENEQVVLNILERNGVF